MIFINTTHPTLHYLDLTPTPSSPISQNPTHVHNPLIIYSPNLILLPTHSLTDNIN